MRWSLAGLALLVAVGCGGSEPVTPSGPRQTDAPRMDGTPTGATRTPVALVTPQPATPVAAQGSTPVPVEPLTPAPKATASTGMPSATPTSRPTPGATPPPPVELLVSATPQYRWSPATVTVPAGSAITFRWSQEVHNLVVDATFGPTSPARGGNHRVVFNSPGAYGFRCEIHPLTMTGVVLVE